MEFVKIEPGTFIMGSPSSESGTNAGVADEAPPHQVTLTTGFWLGKYEITQAQWQAVMGTQPWSGQEYVQSDPQNPAVFISWDDMQAYVHKLNQAAGDSLYRLPTEAEWEYACRAGTTTKWSFGNDDGRLGEYAWYDGNAWSAGEQYAHQVGTKLPNPWGLYDMYGNVWEWCQDWYGTYMDGNPTDPRGPSSGRGRTLRGGYFRAAQDYARSANRRDYFPDFRYYYNGARLVRMLVPAEEPPPAYFGSTSTIDFSTPVTKGTSDTATFTVTNSGSGTLSVSNIVSSNSQFTASPTSFSLSAGASQVVTVTFAPTKVGWERGTLSIAHNMTSSPATVEVSGIGSINPPTGSLANTKIAFMSQRIDPNGEIYVMNVDGTQQIRLTNNPAVDIFPAWSSDGTKIAFLSLRDGSPDLYVMNADGTNPTRLTSDGAVNGYLSWSPDGTKIAFMSRRDDPNSSEIYTVGADGTTLTRLTNNVASDYQPSWSPDGMKVAFASDRDGNGEIYLMNADGSNPTRLTNNPAGDESPSWSPDGTKIAFMSGRDGQIYVMNADGTDPTRLTNESTIDNQPSWSPNGIKIAFRSDRDGQIYFMNADGSNPTRLTTQGGETPAWSPFLTMPTITLSTTSVSFRSAVIKGSSEIAAFSVTNSGDQILRVSDIISTNPQFILAPTVFDIVPGASQEVTVTFAPQVVGWERGTLSIVHNGGIPSSVSVSGVGKVNPPTGDLGRTLIAYQSNRHGSSDIYAIRPGGSQEQGVIRNLGEDVDPDWSTDGKRIAFYSDEGSRGNYRVFLANADGSDAVQWTEGPWDVRPRWAPDGSKILILDATQFRSRLFTVDTRQRGLREVITGLEQVGNPCWSPDGSKIVCVIDNDLVVSDADGTDLVNLTSTPTVEQEPAWSPDGTIVAFRSYREGNEDIYVMDADGANIRRLTTDAANDEEPTWSPDGTKIAFRSRRDGHAEIYTMNADGTGQQRLTFGAVDNWRPAWSAFRDDLPPLSWFSEVALSRGVSLSGGGHGVAWGDYDNDGYLDLFVPYGWLYRNNRDGTFTDMAAATGIEIDNSSGVSWADYDNDGDLDLYSAPRDHSSSYLFQNNAEGTFFVEVGRRAGVKEDARGYGVTWGDYDNDGDLDLYAVMDNTVSNHLYRNEGNGLFSDVAASAGVNVIGPGRGTAWGDYNNDGNLDLYVVDQKDRGAGRRDWLFRNEANGSFHDVSPFSGIDLSGNLSRGVSWADYDNDGYIDLSLAGTIGPLLYRNNNGQDFTNTTQDAGLGGTVGHSEAPVWGDYNNDGDLDLFVSYSTGPVNRLYDNQGDGTFVELGDSLGLSDQGREGQVGSGASWGDFDNDGDLDLYLSNEGGRNRLYVNGGTPNHWLVVKLKGTSSNRDGIGAQVTVKVGPLHQRRDVDGGSGYLSQPSLPVEFGLRGHTTVDSLIIRWPSGIVQLLEKVQADQIIEVEEPALAPRMVVSPSLLVFGTVGEGQIPEQSIWIRNEGYALLLVSTITTSSEDFRVQRAAPLSVAAGDSTELIVSFAPTLPGVFSGTLTIVGNDPNSPLVTVSLSGTLSRTPPAADFSAIPLSGEEPLTVTFSDQSQGVVTSRTWDFGDGETSAEPNPVHTYTRAGTYTVTFTVANEGGSHTTTKANLITLTLPRGLRLSADQLDFGQVLLGQERSLVLYLSNPGDSLLQVSRISVQGGGFVLEKEPFAIGPRGSDSLEVVFRANQSGISEGVLIIETNAKDATQVQIGLKAQGVTPAKLYIQPSILSFGRLRIGSADTLLLDMENQGQATLNVGNVKTEDSQFAILDTITVLAGGENRVLRIVFAPDKEGGSQTNLTIESDDPVQSLAKVVLFGEGRLPNRLPTVALSPIVNKVTGDVSITFALSDPDADTLAVVPEYSKDGGTAWQPATVKGETQELTTEKYQGTLLWQSAQDLPGFEGQIYLRLLPDDGAAGIADTVVVELDNNQPPVVTFTLPETGARQVHIAYETVDTEADPVSLDIIYSTDGKTWKSATLSLDGTKRGELVWDTLADVGYGLFADVQVRIVARDTEEGPAAVQSLTIHNLAGDFDGDLLIGEEDLTLFLVAWNQAPRDLKADIGPAAGKVPDLRPGKDGKLDFEDLMVLVQMWNWSTRSYVPAKLVANLQISHAMEAASSLQGTYAQVELKSREDGLLAAGLELAYDPQAWELIAVEPGNAFPDSSGVLLLKKEISPGKFIVYLGSLAGSLSAEGSLARLLFRPQGQGQDEIALHYSLHGLQGEAAGAGTLSLSIRPVPAQSFLAGNSPNPFNPETQIAYGLPVPASVQLKIYDILGREVRSLFDVETKGPGIYQVRWDGRDAQGRLVGSGVYLYQLRLQPTGRGAVESYTRRMLLLR